MMRDLIDGTLLVRDGHLAVAEVPIFRFQEIGITVRRIQSTSVTCISAYSNADELR